MPQLKSSLPHPFLLLQSQQTLLPQTGPYQEMEIRALPSLRPYVSIFSISLTSHSEPANLHFYVQHISTFCLLLTTSPTSPVQISIFCSDDWNYFLIALRHLLSPHFHLLACSNQMAFLNIPLLKTFQWLLFKIADVKWLCLLILGSASF